jgi:hypothetical protein
MEETIVKIPQDSPLFIVEAEKKGEFYNPHSAYAESLEARYKTDEAKRYILGKDIKETPTQGLTLAIETSSTMDTLKNHLLFIHELKKLASISSQDYVSYKELTFVGKNDYFDVMYLIEPRLFTKLNSKP